MQVKSKISIDLKQRAAQELVNAVQNDSNTRVIEIQLFDGGAAWVVPSGATVALGYRKSDGKKGVYDTLPNGQKACTVSGNTVTIILAKQALTTPGMVNAVVTMHDAAYNQLSTIPFSIRVHEDPAADAVKSDDYYNYTSWEELSNAADAWFAEQDKKIAETLEGIKRVSAPSIVEPVRGEIITVSDASDLPLAGLKVFGKTEQRTTTGKNLLPNTATTKIISGVTFTVNEDGSITANGKAVGGSAAFAIGIFEVTDGQQYILTGCPEGGSTVSYRLTLAAYGWNDTGAGYVFTATKRSGVTVVIAEGCTVSNMTFWPMIRLASVTDATYEPYTGGKPSPSPEYPQELESVGNSVNVTVCGKNLFPTAVVGGNYQFTSSGDGVFTFTDQARSQTEVIVTLMKGVTHTLSCTRVSGSGALPCLIFRRPDNTNISSNYSNTTNPVTVTPTETETETVRVILQVQAATTNCTLGDSFVIQLELGDTATEYEPYKEPQPLAISTPVDSSGNSLLLPGIPVESGGNYTDETGKHWICDEVDFEKGVYVQNIRKRRLLSTDGWNKYAPIDNVFFNAVYTDIKPIKTIGSSIVTAYLCSHLSVLEGTTNVTTKPNCISLYYATEHSGYRCFMNVSGITTVEELKAYLDANEVYIAYAVANPSKHKLSAEEIAQYAALHSNYPNTTVFNDKDAGMEVKYVADTQKYIDKKFEALDAKYAGLAAALVNNA